MERYRDTAASRARGTTIDRTLAEGFRLLNVTKETELTTLLRHALIAVRECPNSPTADYSDILQRPTDATYRSLTVLYAKRLIERRWDTEEHGWIWSPA